MPLGPNSSFRHVAICTHVHNKTNLTFICKPESYTSSCHTEPLSLTLDYTTYAYQHIQQFPYILGNPVFYYAT